MASRRGSGGKVLSVTHPPQRLKSLPLQRSVPPRNRRNENWCSQNGSGFPGFSPSLLKRSNIHYSFRQAYRSRKNSLLPNPGKKFFQPPPFPSRKLADGYSCSIDEHHSMRRIALLSRHYHQLSSGSSQMRTMRQARRRGTDMNPNLDDWRLRIIDWMSMGKESLRLSVQTKPELIARTQFIKLEIPAKKFLTDDRLSPKGFQRNRRAKAYLRPRAHKGTSMIRNRFGR